MYTGAMPTESFCGPLLVFLSRMLELSKNTSHAPEDANWEAMISFYFTTSVRISTTELQHIFVCIM